MKDLCVTRLVGGGYKLDLGRGLALGKTLRDEQRAGLVTDTEETF